MPRKFEVIIYDKEDGIPFSITEELLRLHIIENRGLLKDKVRVKEVIYKVTTEERNDLLVKEMFDLLNLMGNDRNLVEKFTNHILTEHRTLIQTFFRIIQHIIHEYSKNGSCDGRNRGSLDWAKQVDEIESYMPLI